MNKKTFTAQQGSAETIKIFNAETGSLHRVIHVGGKIVSSPVVSGHTVSVGIKSGEKTALKIYNMQSGSLQSTTII